MGKYPGSVTGLSVRSGWSFARGTTIDEYLSPEDNQELYKIWKSTWPEVLKFHGEVTAITCEMVLEVNEAEFLATFGNTKKAKEMAARILEVSKRNAGR